MASLQTTVGAAGPADHPDLSLPLHLRAGGVSLVLDSPDGRMPYVLHWGADLGDLGAPDLLALRLLQEPQTVPNTVDVHRPEGMVAEHATGWPGTPGLRGSRKGADWSPSFTVEDLLVEEPADQATDGGVAVRAVYRMRDAVARLGLVIEAEVMSTGLLRLRASIRNDDLALYRTEALQLSLPVPTRASELLDFTGRHVRERSPQRQPFTVGARVRDSLRGRTGTDATLLLIAGVDGFGFRRGEVWGVHVAWSGNHRTFAERVPLGASRLGGGELLLPGEIVLHRDESYTSPWLYAAYGDGLDELSGRIHGYLRSRPQHPRTARPVVLNTWEAVYFEHDLAALKELADLGAEIGVERYVLDDGWFHGRRGDHAGLGDWWVDADVWPDGLHPLVDHVRSLGLEFGLWVEPEMVNQNSELARAHPEWILKAGGRMPVESRNQQVLDLGNPDAWGYLLERLDALLTEYDIGYLKWDHNRDLVDAGSGPSGVPGVHRQTDGFYRLVDELRRRYPHVEIESCSSGGGRIDLEVLQRTDRVWTSDTIDPLERQSIQRWTGLLVPPEMLGTHVGAPRAHTTHRTHDLPFRAGTAVFGHMGVEWDLRTATPAQREELARWIALHKELRGLLATGTVVRLDHPDPALLVHGVVAADRSEAVYAVVAVAGALTSPPGPVPLPGLDERRTYRVEPLPPADVVAGPQYSRLAWFDLGATVRGSVLARAGVQAPVLFPEQLVLLRARALGDGAGA